MIYLNGLFCFFDNSSFDNVKSITSFQTTIKKSCYFLKVNDLLKVAPDTIVSVSFSWSSFLCITSMGEAILFGYSDGRSCQLLKLIPPDESLVAQGTCGNRNCHLVTREGAYWLYDKRTHGWKNVTQLLNAEKTKPESIIKNENSPITKVVCGNQMNLAMDESGCIYSVPSRIELPGIQVIDVACGKEHSLLLTSTYSVYSWGNGSRGQLGHGSIEGEYHPREVAALCGLRVTSIAAGGWHSCCVTDEHDLYSWGWNCCGQLGFPGENQEVAEKTLKIVSVLAEPRVVDWPGDHPVNVRQVSCGTRHTVALLDDDSAWGCGWNYYRQLSGDLPETVFCMTKLSVPASIKIRKVICGEWNSAFVAEECLQSNSE